MLLDEIIIAFRPLATLGKESFPSPAQQYQKVWDLLFAGKRFFKGSPQNVDSPAFSDTFFTSTGKRRKL